MYILGIKIYPIENKNVIKVCAKYFVIKDSHLEIHYYIQMNGVMYEFTLDILYNLYSYNNNLQNLISFNLHSANTVTLTHDKLTTNANV